MGFPTRFLSPTQSPGAQLCDNAIQWLELWTEGFWASGNANDILGMGNRFRDIAQYHTLIKGHAILAAITFLGIVPLAIFAVRFWWYPQRAQKLHMWLQITTVLTSTIVLVLGYFAVGPERSLSNPHHGIGIAIYVLILFQAIYGWLVRKMEKGRDKWKVSVKLMLHQWIGRATALLAIAQLPLGLTLYGSPKVLFILYAVWVALLIALWFVFTHRYQSGTYYDGSSSYFTNTDGTRTDITHERRSHSHHGGGLVKTAAGVGLVGAALGFLNRKKNKETEETHTEVTNNRPHHSHHGSYTSYTGSSYMDDKTSIHKQREQHTWRDRLLAGAGVAAAFGLGKKLFGRKDKPAQSEYSDYSSGYGPYTASRTELSRLEEGHGPVTPGPPIRRSEEHLSSVVIPSAAAGAAVGAGSPLRNQRQRLRRSGDSISESESYYSPGREKRSSHGLRNTIATMGVAGFIKHKLSQRGQKKEQGRVEEIKETDRIQEERMRRRQSQTGGRLTGDGRTRRHNSFSASEVTPLSGSTPALSRHNLARPLTTAGAGTTSYRRDSRIDRTRLDERQDIHDSMSSLVPPPPIGGRYHQGSSSSEGHGTPAGGRNNQHELLPGLASTSPGLLAEEENRRRSSVNSPPLSIKMRMRDDNGRQHVTLRRLSPAEAAAEREAVRIQRGGRVRSNSISSIGDGGQDRWRRTEALETQQAAEERGSRQSLASQQHNIIPGPPPPPPPLRSGAFHSSSPGGYEGSMLSPPAMGGSGMYDTGDSAAGSKADSNRRRRRAERAREQGARLGSRVEFS